MRKAPHQVQQFLAPDDRVRPEEGRRPLAPPVRAVGLRVPLRELPHGRGHLGGAGEVEGGAVPEELLPGHEEVLVEEREEGDDGPGAVVGGRLRAGYGGGQRRAVRREVGRGVHLVLKHGELLRANGLPLKKNSQL